MHYKEHFISVWPQEGVGYLKDGEFYPLENVAEDKIHSFAVDPSFLLEEPDALIHSHTTGHEVQYADPRAPSYEDLANQIATDIEWGICVTDGQVCEDPIWWGNPDNRPALLGREFIFNVQDCLSLLQDYYYQERGIVLPSQARTFHWNQEGQNYMEELYESWGFKRIELSELQAGDLLLYKVRSPVANHIGIYMGNNEVLSHWYGRTSCVESFGKWANYIHLAARYQP